MTAANVPLFENRDWTVSPSGLEHKGTGYFIGRDLIGDRRDDGLWSWPVHMAEKVWVRPASFAEAFTSALRAYDILPDAELAASFAAGDEEAGRGDGFPRPTGPDAIRFRPAKTDWPDLPAWARPEGQPDPRWPLVPRPDLPSQADRVAFGRRGETAPGGAGMAG